ncbi:AFG1-like ATPase-domain-containing protein [Calycina marina]|uniref:AFG1-like ATPase-domain-containing protein n=1 Tax=Calycina marina TaxID=1763456 RepID=A0A9P7Z0A0_9HELO|nr:AFG1-like ATPase-domain-containing protein [Calycina marina]
MSKATLQTAYRALLQQKVLTRSPSQEMLVTRLAKLQDDLVTLPHSPQQGLYVYGGVGTGKSRIADLFSDTLPAPVSRRRVHFNEFMIDIHSRLHYARSQRSFSGDPLVEIGQNLRSESRVLCFDEFQVTDIADAMILKRLFGAFWENGGTMASTSNRHPDKLYENGLNRSLFLPFIADLQERCEVWNLEGSQDYRLGKGFQKTDVRKDIFYTDKKEFGRVVEEAVNGAKLKEAIIPVMMNRQLNVLATEFKYDGKVIAKCTFEQLCEKFLGSADYHALCKKSRIVFLTGLRKFEADELDFVRRFVTLIDLAYEAKTRVICLSSVPMLEAFANIVPSDIPIEGELRDAIEKEMTVKGEGGSSSSMMSTFMGNMEWSATGLATVSLATNGAGESDVKFAVGRAVSRLFEMGSGDFTRGL